MQKYTPSDTIQPVRFKASDFGEDFVWGAAASAFQTEGACRESGKSLSIWDTFSARRGRIKNSDTAEIATDFYNRFNHDLNLVREMQFKAFRFSLSWPRILPGGTGAPDPGGIDYYNNLINACLERGIEPWITIYHWDLPQILEERGGWTNRDMISWFEEYVSIVLKNFGDRVNNWIVLNEPIAFSGLGYLMGKHAPGRRGLRNFLPALHNACLCQAAGGRIIRGFNTMANIGTTYSVSSVIPASNTEEDCIAATRLDAGLNRLSIEPALGMGYPVKILPVLQRLEKYMHANDERDLKFDFDFIGLQYYFRVMIAHSWLPPFHLREIPPSKRGVPLSSMGYEIYPQGIFPVLKKIQQYSGIKKLIISEAGVSLPDQLLSSGQVCDTGRINYYGKLLESILLAKRIGIPISGFFAWSLTDNFEWSDGYDPRFGLVYVDYKTQNRYMKDSGKWFREFLNR
jgi:beta-glucosidase